MDDKLKLLIEFIATEMWRESMFLGPNPQWNIEVVSLLDKIHEIYGITREEVGSIVNPVRERIESSRHQ